VVTPYVADLYLHTAFSPCAGCRMVPKLILDREAEIGPCGISMAREWGRRG